MFITFLGTHASGKSAFTGMFARCLDINIITKKRKGERKKPKVHTDDEGKCVLVGGYGQRDDNVYTGGLDGAGTQQNRFDMVAEQWLDPNREIIIAESHMIWYWESFWDRVRDELLPKVQRDIILLFLDVPMDELIRRWESRSKGKEFTEKRRHHLEMKARKSERLPEEVCEDEVLKDCTYYKRLPHVDQKDMDAAVHWLLTVICELKEWSINEDFTWNK